jgi:hypothetical protein
MLRRSFPHVKVVCGAVDEELREVWLDGNNGDGHSATEGRKCWVVDPGMGQIGETLSCFGLFSSQENDCCLQVIVTIYKGICGFYRWK